MMDVRSHTFLFMVFCLFLYGVVGQDEKYIRTMETPPQYLYILKGSLLFTKDPTLAEKFIIESPALNGDKESISIKSAISGLYIRFELSYTMGKNSFRRKFYSRASFKKTDAKYIEGSYTLHNAKSEGYLANLKGKLTTIVEKETLKNREASSFQHVDPASLGLVSVATPTSSKNTGWSECSKTCGKGFQRALFPCSRKSCFRKCKLEKCRKVKTRPPVIDFPEKWTSCSKTCGTGRQMKIQPCPKGCKAVFKTCVLPKCVKSKCSKSCGGGVRVVKCKKKRCRGIPKVEKCNTHPCKEIPKVGVCTENHCANGKCVAVKGGFKCECSSGFSGVLCDEGEYEENECSDELCNNNGLCEGTDLEFTCTCYPGYTGQTCDMELNPCDSNPCKFGTCSSSSGGYICKCSEGYTGNQCDQEFNHCDSSPCKFGTCSSSLEGYNCKCSDGYIGKQCDQELNHCDSSPCKFGACSSMLGGYNCKCSHGYTGKQCDQEINHCKPTPCKFGDCSSSLDGFKCKCWPGYKGVRCEEKIDPCESAPCVNGKCVPQSIGFTCDCASGYTETKCDKKIDFCADDPCHNGECLQKDGGFECVCYLGYEGIHCTKETDFCERSLCQRGSCISSKTGFTCECEPGFTGDKCEQEIDYCQPNPCKEGNCKSTLEGFVCECFPGTSGPTCGIVDFCKLNPCVHGTCIMGETLFTCECDEGYTGDDCGEEIKTDPCDPNPCNNGTCISWNSQYYCDCNLGFKGEHCESQDVFEISSQCTKTCGGGSRYSVLKCGSEDITKCPRIYEGCNYQPCPPDSLCLNTSFTNLYKSNQCCLSVKEDLQCGTNKKTVFAQRIIGGYLADLGTWPWAVLLQIESSKTSNATCGATLVHPQWLLTAAHCVSRMSASIIHAVLGTTNANIDFITTQRRAIEQIIVHEDYSFPKSDLALLKLKEPAIITNYVRPICLPQGERTPIDKKCFAVGWGIAKVENILKAIASDDLMEVSVKNLDFGVCRSGYLYTGIHSFLNHKMLCAGDIDGGVDTCMGDSGGPLMCQRCSSCEWYLAGITSFGATNCGAAGKPGVYTNILFYEDWIKKHVTITDARSFSCMG